MTAPRRPWLAHRIAGLAAALGVVGWPGVAQGGAWTEPEGKLWTKVSVVHLDADRIFADGDRQGELCGEPPRPIDAGDRVPFDCQLEGGGGQRITQMSFGFAFGLHRRVDLRLQIPVFLKSTFKDTKTAVRRGIGDIRFGAQGLILREPVVTAVRIRAKAPTGLFTPDALGVPLGEGQWDLTTWGLVSKSFLKGRIWAGVQGGFRKRFKNEEADLEPGNEVVAALDVGGTPARWLYLQQRMQLQWGFKSERTDLGFSQKLAARRFFRFEWKAGVRPLAHTDSDFKSFQIEAGVRMPVWGRGWQAAPTYFVGISHHWRVFEPYSEKRNVF